MQAALPVDGGIRHHSGERSSQADQRAARPGQDQWQSARRLRLPHGRLRDLEGRRPPGEVHPSPEVRWVENPVRVLAPRHPPPSQHVNVGLAGSSSHGGLQRGLRPGPVRDRDTPQGVPPHPHGTGQGA